MQGEKALFSSNSVEWGTPRFLYDWLDQKYHFELDPCASKSNHKHKLYFTQEDNGLVKDWSAIASSAFMNPPYLKAEVACKKNCKKQKCIKRGYHLTEAVPGIGDWMRKAYNESLKGMDVICLVPNRSDTAWFENYVTKADEVYQIGGRIQFENELQIKGKCLSATFPSIIVCYLGKDKKISEISVRPKYYYIKINKKIHNISIL